MCVCVYTTPQKFPDELLFYVSGVLNYFLGKFTAEINFIQTFPFSLHLRTKQK